MEQTPQTVNDYVSKLNLYVELSTSRIYEGKLFEEFILMRPLLPPFAEHIKKVPMEKLGLDFEDYEGDRTSMTQFLKRYVPMQTESVQ